MISPLEYAGITGRSPTEATEHRVNRAAALLSARIGQAVPEDLSDEQTFAAKEWVAQAIAMFAESKDAPQAAENIRLGRFQVSTPEAQQSPYHRLGFADALVASSGLVNRAVRTTRKSRSVEQEPIST